jgi:recombination protein RecA
MICFSNKYKGVVILPINDEKRKALEKTLGEIHKKFGKESVQILGEKPVQKIDAISSGSLKIDEAIGIGGVPRGRIVEIFGPESAGKTTLATHIIAEAQKSGGFAAIIDVEHAFDPLYAQRLGVNTDELIISQPDTAEQALEIAEELVRSGVVDVVVIDSVAALAPKAEIEGEMGASHVGLQARLMSQALRKLTAVVSQTKSIVIFINQLREKVGIMFGSPETTPGGRALKFYSSVRLDVRKIESIKQGSNIIGNRIKVKVVKNKVAPPFKEAGISLIFGEGIDKIGEIIDIGVEKGIIEKSGSWFSYNGMQLAQGKENTRQYLKENPQLLNEIENKVMAELGFQEKEAADTDIPDGKPKETKTSRKKKSNA